jgi:tetratricopeptide (TPR) repeat protein
MNSLKKLIHEAHRRSLWQVLGIFLATSWGVLQGVEFLTDFAGLPDWTPAMALVLLMIGLPICVATAFVQEGMPGQQAEEGGAGAEAGHGSDGPASEGTTPANFAESANEAAPSTRATFGTRRFLTWKNAVLGGVGAFALLGFSLIAYFIMWETGIGPVGNLVAQGVLEEGDPVLLADFENSTGDASLGEVVTEALRVDLARTQAITLVEPSAVREHLELMGRAGDERVAGDVADEVAARGGYAAIIEGEVGAAGSGYIFTATLRSPETGETLATFRRTSADESGVIEAIDGLSQDIRERAGESLRSIRAGEPLEAVTTSSLEALRLFTEANVIRDGGDEIRARALIDEALRLDPEFAMAWRAKAVLLQAGGAPQPEVRAAATRAYELRERLSERERYYASAMYHNYVTGDMEEQTRAYEMVLADFPDDRNALNNLSIVYSDRARWEDASELLEQAVNGPGTSFAAHANRPLYYSLSGDFEMAATALEELETDFPASELWPAWGGVILGFSSWDAETAGRRSLQLQNVPDGASWRRTGTRALGLTAALTGEMARAREILTGAVRESERAEAWNDLAQAWADLAIVEELVGSGDPSAAVGALVDDALMARMQPRYRNNEQWISLAAWAGREADARRLLAEWQADAADLQEAAIRRTSEIVDAYAMRTTDPAGGAAVLVRLRTTERCARCWAWELGSLYEAAGMTAEAVAERERSLEAGQDFYFGFHRLAAHEALGRLHEELGDPQRAADYYRIYVDQMSNGAGLPRVDRTRERLAALGAGD